MIGREFFARLWHFIHQGTFMGIVDDDALNNERENARIALVGSLAKGFEDDQIICNPGKIQHIAIGVLQGRLKGVLVDKEVDEKTVLKETVATSLRDFLSKYASMVTTQQALKAHAEKWLQNERGFQGEQIEAYKRQFKQGLADYLNLSDVPEQDTDLEREEPLQATDGSTETIEVAATSETALRAPLQATDGGAETNQILEHSAEQFNAKKKQIQDSFLTYLDVLDENTNKNRPSTANVCKRLKEDLSAAQDDFFKKLTINMEAKELEQAIINFRHVCKAHVTTADRMIGHGWLYRIIETTLKAVLGLFCGVGMILGAAIGRGVLSTQDKQTFKQTFFTLHETSEQRALRTFEKQTLGEEEEEGLLSTKSFQTECN